MQLYHRISHNLGSYFVKASLFRVILVVSDYRLSWLGFEMFLGLLGSYCSYQLPKHDGATSQIQVNPTQLRDHQNHPVQTSE